MKIYANSTNAREYFNSFISLNMCNHRLELAIGEYSSRLGSFKLLYMTWKTMKHFLFKNFIVLTVPQTVSFDRWTKKKTTKM